MIEVTETPAAPVAYNTTHVGIYSSGFAIDLENIIEIRPTKDGKLHLLATVSPEVREELLTISQRARPVPAVNVNGDPIYPEDLKCEDEEA